MIVELAENIYLPVNRIAERYGISKRAVYAIAKEMEGCSRYKKAWITINDGGSRLINTLVLEDYLRHRKELKHPNIARQLPPYNPSEVRKQRGELSAVIEKVTPEPDAEELKRMFLSFVSDAMKEALKCAKTI